MTAAKRSLKIEQGATFTKSWTWMTGRRKTAPPVDLTGCTARMQVRPQIDSATVLIELTTENGRIALGGTAGTVALRIEALDTADVTWKTGVYDLEVEFSEGTVRRFMQGGVSVSPGVTRNA